MVRPPLDLNGVAEWIVERGLQGPPIDEQFAGFAQRIYKAGFPMKRVGFVSASRNDSVNRA